MINKNGLIEIFEKTTSKKRGISTISRFHPSVIKAQSEEVQHKVQSAMKNG
jgi:hypothetical protein